MKIRKNTADEELLYISAEDEVERATAEKYYKEGGAVIAIGGQGEFMLAPPSKSEKVAFFVNKDELFFIASALNGYPYKGEGNMRMKLIERILKKLEARIND
jgi:hypothetical protein